MIMAFKIALTAGHYMETPGKRCLKSLDQKETREWWLNDRIADKVEKLLAANYTGYELLRTDDTTGKARITIEQRTTAANKFGADFYLSIHHNAGINGGKGGGICAIVHTKPSAESVAWQKDLYNALIANTGLKGNRATPLAKMNLHEVREPKMPSVLLELGFMDSATDVPVILTEKFADQCAAAIVSVLAKRGGLKPKPVQKPSGKIYRVQVGTYSEKANAEAMLSKLKKAGFDGYITTDGGTAAEPEPVKKSIDEIAREVIQGKWGSGTTRKNRLAQAGYDYAEVQKRVNELLKS